MLTMLTTNDLMAKKKKVDYLFKISYSFNYGPSVSLRVAITFPDDSTLLGALYMEIGLICQNFIVNENF